MAHYTRIEFSLDHELNNLNTTPRIAQIPLRGPFCFTHNFFDENIM
ncbi:hypothetical protein LEP1GSC137_3954 [Leptospira borgpetersenii str. Noumea 25]|uniref:Uncharacterized protein n=3 Tax=Leptospira borgpetersenii TaxID=174 RepID=M3H4D1_LEPBO|nr:hypothetical protein LBBP_02746 [Leptospira borgpetersenii serovar Ballum]EKP14964.1 hypothetical protein LEP1GSC128_2255 [Leptospira borgpetersenii str. 200801926]EKQ90298.1 hypothetical protein LEP1GSC101_2083 [Leptospira borgpetersenii str. UI 09149]EKQ99201.1 hypothetical protein LEP1GSC121_2676 [Leptospira borgpetersenii serovar Castellonis str. 200801910]EMG01949.1 hypothetical protein LEP1GSC123_0324 [Leptospira borgpetersenii str. 200701203]EMK12668.1 hypothetical protein LEP1GSC066